MGSGLFSLEKNKALKPKDPIFKGGFHAECRVLPRSGRCPAGRPEILHLATMPASSSNSTWALYFHRKRKKTTEDLRGKATPSYSLLGTARGGPKHSSRRGLVSELLVSPQWGLRRAASPSEELACLEIPCPAAAACFPASSQLPPLLRAAASAFAWDSVPHWSCRAVGEANFSHIC